MSAQPGKAVPPKKVNMLMPIKADAKPKLRKLLLSFGSALCLVTRVGCAVGPDYHPPETKVSSNWDGQNFVIPATPSKTNINPVTLVEWWTAFNDPTLSSLVDRAVRANLDVRLAEARIRQARAARGVAGAPLWPQVDASALYQRSQGSSEVGGGGAVATVGGTSGICGRRVSMPPGRSDIFGGTRRNLEAATADLQAAVEDRRDVLVTLMGDVGTNYINLRGFQQQIDIARKNLEAQKHTADIIQKRHDAGFVGGLDVANAKAQVATTEATIPVFESSARGAIYSLGVLLGREPGALTQDLAKAGPIPPTPREIPVGLPSELLRRRPDIRRAEAQIHAATARIGVATSDLFPKFNLAGSYGFSAVEAFRLARSTSNFWSWGPSVTWPILLAAAFTLISKSRMPSRSKRC